MATSVLVLVPLYRDFLDAVEQFGLDKSLAKLGGREVRFIAPQDLDARFFENRYPALPIERLPAPAFASIPEYNRLLLSPWFYERYSAAEFMLILQTDAVVLRDELDYWCAQPFDYVGAPWPKTFELFVNTGRFEGAFGKHVRVGVGNGGFSLRRSRKCLALLNEFPVELDLFQKTGSSEDLFFSVMGSLSIDFIVPNEITASRFSMEGHPTYYFQTNGGCMPMGAHAWMKNELEFWLRAMPDAALLFPSHKPDST